MNDVLPIMSVENVPMAMEYHSNVKKLTILQKNLNPCFYRRMDAWLNGPLFW